jgi:hypothetical protein
MESFPVGRWSEEMPEIWNSRTCAMDAIESELQPEASIIYQSFSLLDEMLVVFHSEDAAFCRVVGLILLKARNLSQGYSA